MPDSFMARFSEQVGVQCANAPLWLLGALIIVLMSLAYLRIGRGRYWLGWRKAFGHVFPKDLYFTRDVGKDIFIFFTSDFVLGPLANVLVAFVVVINIGEATADWLGPGPRLVESSSLVAAVQFITIYLFGDFLSYWSHRLAHKYPILWGGHRAHHSAEKLNIFVARRGHIVEGLVTGVPVALIQGLFFGVIAYFTGGALSDGAKAAFLLIPVFHYPIAFFQHMHLPISFGRLDYIFISPATHQIHHSAELRHRDRNFGALLSIFDWVFGTLYIPAEGEVFRYGLNDHEMGAHNPHRTLKGFYFEPFVYVWNAFKQPFRRGRVPTTALEFRALRKNMGNVSDE